MQRGDSGRKESYKAGRDSVEREQYCAGKGNKEEGVLFCFVSSQASKTFRSWFLEDCPWSEEEDEETEASLGCLHMCTSCA